MSTIKTRLQCQGATIQTSLSNSIRYGGPIDAFMSIVRNEGVLSLYKGIGVVIGAAAPAQALYFAGYESFK